MIEIDFEVNWSRVKVTMTYNNVAVGFGPAYALSG